MISYYWLTIENPTLYSGSSYLRYSNVIRYVTLVGLQKWKTFESFRTKPFNYLWKLTSAIVPCGVSLSNAAHASQSPQSNTPSRVDCLTA